MKTIKTFEVKDNEGMNAYLATLDENNVNISYSPETVVITYNDNPLKTASIKYLDDQLAIATGSKLQALIDLATATAVIADANNSSVDLGADNSEMANAIDKAKEQIAMARGNLSMIDLNLTILNEMKSKIVNDEELEVSPEPIEPTKIEDGEVEPVAEATPDDTKTEPIQATEDSIGSGV